MHEINRVYDKKGKPITMLEWSALLGDDEYKRIRLTNVFGVKVSTVWLGLDHSYGTPRKLIFETMFFGKYAEGDYQKRYSTKTKAIIGHYKACLDALEFIIKNVIKKIYENCKNARR